MAERKGYKGLDEAIKHAKDIFGAKIVQIELDLRNFSSTELKGRLELDYNITDYIMPEIASYIAKHNLYKNYSVIVNYLKNNLTERTFNHSVRTTIFALQYANALGLSFEKVFLASLLHDVAKNCTYNDSEYEGVPIAVKHQYKGKEIAEHILNINDSEILEAIEFHSTGKPQMSLLGKLVYVADKLEQQRSYSGVVELRAELNKNFEEGFKKVVKSQLNFIEKSTQSIDDLTKQCALWYNLNT